jgi:hypothetical protein
MALVLTTQVAAAQVHSLKVVHQRSIVVVLAAAALEELVLLVITDFQAQ